MSIGDISLAVIAIVYVGFAIAGIVGLFILIGLYKDIKRSVDELKKQMEPYRSAAQDMVYKAQQITDVAAEIATDVKQISSKTKETAEGILDKTSHAADEVVSLVIDTKKRTQAHIAYLFERIEAIEERLDNIYAYLKGAGVLVSKLRKNKEEE